MFSFSRKREPKQSVDRVPSPDVPPALPQRPVEPDPSSTESPKGKRAYLNSYLKIGWDKSVELSKEEAIKGRIYLEKAVGLGAQPNVIPPDEAIVNGPSRIVELGWHPVAGFSGKWFAERTRLGQKITKEIGKYPDPTQHWAVLVGDYCHQLWMDEKLDVIYINERVNRDEWQTFTVGNTRFNDEALRQTGEMSIHNMCQKRPAYNLISNNCQNFAVEFLDAIQVGAHTEFATTFAIYSRATGKGSIKDLFTDPPQDAPSPTQAHQTHDATMQYAQQVMDQNTTKLDDHHYHTATDYPPAPSYPPRTPSPMLPPRPQYPPHPVYP